jgi:REP element-mobilizing transposase RayT
MELFNMQSKEIAIPLAYFITFSCYGTWLHGEKETSVDRDHNIPKTEFLSFNQARQISAKKRMLEIPYFLDEPQRQIVLNTIKEVCQYREWTLMAAHVRTNHVHLIVHAMLSPENIMNTIKAYSSRRLNESKLDNQRMNRWTRHGSTRYLWREEDIEATIQYVVYEQGSPMAVFENKDHSFKQIAQ